MLKAAVDNDVILKAACYCLLPNLISVIPCTPGEVGILGAARFVLPVLLRRAPLRGDRAAVSALLGKLFGDVNLLEPTDQEVRFAAQLEALAQSQNLSVDTGESQLCAMAIHRSILMVTGDKRAIAALQNILHPHGSLTSLAGRITCLEQLCERLVIAYGTRVRTAICNEPQIDKALTACFACLDPKADQSVWLKGLRSYIGHLRGIAPTLLSA